jgi:hypothetical protein
MWWAQPDHTRCASSCQSATQTSNVSLAQIALFKNESSRCVHVCVHVCMHVYMCGLLGRFSQLKNAYGRCIYMCVRDMMHIHKLYVMNLCMMHTYMNTCIHTVNRRTRPFSASHVAVTSKCSSRVLSYVHSFKHWVGHTLLTLTEYDAKESHYQYMAWAAYMVNTCLCTELNAI